MFTIYKTTNLLNGKIYIGAHREINNDTYMGSGKHLLRAINKYGKENFSKEILFKFESEEEMYSKEAELVNEEFVLRKDTYNMKLGGFGGKSYIKISDETRLKISENTTKGMIGRKHSDQTRHKMSEVRKGIIFSNETKLKMSKSASSRIRQPLSKETIEKIRLSHIGKSRSTESKNKMSLAKKGKKLSEEHKLNISKASKGRTYPMAQPCPHCGKIVRQGSYKRWHGDNCKMRILG